jgi:hypothetical protein
MAKSPLIGPPSSAACSCKTRTPSPAPSVALAGRRVLEGQGEGLAGWVMRREVGIGTRSAAGDRRERGIMPDGIRTMHGLSRDEYSPHESDRHGHPAVG